MNVVCKHIDCPHYHGNPEGVGSCDDNEMRCCDYELTKECEIYKEIIEEWEK